MKLKIKSSLKAVFTIFRESLFISINYISLLLLILSLLETICIYPPVHSYNIGPPFYWFLRGSPPLFLITLCLTIASLSIIHRYGKNTFQGLVRLILVVGSLAILLLMISMVNLYRNPSYMGGRSFEGLLMLIGLLPAYFASIILSARLRNVLENKLKLRSWQYTLALGIVTVISVVSWWYLVGVWKIGL